MNIQKQDKCKTNPHKINVALVSDFYYPFVGGVQIHIKQLATLLSKNQQMGNVIVITHKYDHHSLQYTGVRNHHGFRVYYLNIHYNKQHMITYPTFIFNFNTAAKILREQNIDIVHCHQTGSTLGLEFIFFARILGLRVLLTQHSLYGFRSISDIHFNRVSQLFVNFCDFVIAVSKTTRNNIILRTGIEKNKVIVIPNGVSDISAIRKKRQSNLMNKSKDQNNQIIKIISVGRMTFRRGTDILIQILPQLCAMHQNIQILIVGDGVKRKAVQKIIEIHQLHLKVKMLGIISSHEALLEKMAQCDIFLNTPLTESFGIALAEAAMLGLCCVSTNVGGVEQAIPKSHLFVSKVDPRNLLQVLSIAIQKVRKQQKPVHSTEIFEYKWQNVCSRTVQLYATMMKKEKMSKKYYMKKAFMTGNLLEIFFAALGFILGVLYSLPFFK